MQRFGRGYSNDCNVSVSRTATTPLCNGCCSPICVDSQFCATARAPLRFTPWSLLCCADCRHCNVLVCAARLACAAATPFCNRLLQRDVRRFAVLRDRARTVAIYAVVVALLRRLPTLQRVSLCSATCLRSRDTVLQSVAAARFASICSFAQLPLHAMSTARLQFTAVDLHADLHEARNGLLRADNATLFAAVRLACVNVSRATARLICRSRTQAIVAALFARTHCVLCERSAFAAESARKRGLPLGKTDRAKSLSMFMYLCVWVKCLPCPERSLISHMAFMHH